MDKRLERQLEEVLKLPGNDTCADCHAPAPRWASINIGIFLCVGCASVHRKLGTHKSRVKSVTLDTWSRDQITHIKSIGNLAANAVWNPNEKLHPPPTSSTHEERDSELERYIRKKYEMGAFRNGSGGAGARKTVEPTSLNRARERDGRLPAGSAGVKEGALGGNAKNPELNDIVSRRDGRERDLPALPFGSSTGKSSGSAPPRPRPTRSPSNNYVNSVGPVWNTAASTSGGTAVAGSRGGATKEANLIDFSDTTANNATLPLQINMSSGSAQQQQQQNFGSNGAGLGVSAGGAGGSWNGNSNAGGAMRMGMGIGMAGPSQPQQQQQFLSPQMQPGSWNTTSPSFSNQGTFNTSPAFGTSPSLSTSPYGNMQFGTSPQFQQQPQSFGTSPNLNGNGMMYAQSQSQSHLSPSPQPQAQLQFSPQAVYDQHLSPQPSFATGGQMSPQPTFQQGGSPFVMAQQSFQQQPAHQQQQQYVNAMSTSSGVGFGGSGYQMSQPVMSQQGHGQGYGYSQQWMG